LFCAFGSFEDVESPGRFPPFGYRSDSSAHSQAYPLTDLGVPAGNQDNSSFAVNNAGQGEYSRDGVGRGRFAMRHPWSGGAAIDLGGLPGALGGQAQAIKISRGRALGEGRHISREQLRRNGADSCLNRSNREFPVPCLLSPCYLPDTSLLCACYLPVIFPTCGRCLILTTN
jgi:hypothetical protein